MQEDRTLLNVSLITAFATLQLSLLVLLGNDFDFDTVDTTDQFGFEDRFSLLLAAFNAWARAGAVDTSRNRNTHDFHHPIAIDAHEEAVESPGKSNGHRGGNLKVGVGGRDNQRRAICGLLLVCVDGLRPWVYRVESRMCVQRDLGNQSVIDAYRFVSNNF